jgi:hypothetical protein
VPDERVRIEIALAGGQTISTPVEVAVADALQRALANDAGGVYELETQDGTYAIPLRAVTYVKRFARDDTQVGFGRDG